MRDTLVVNECTQCGGVTAEYPGFKPMTCVCTCDDDTYWINHTDLTEDEYIDLIDCSAMRDNTRADKIERGILYHLGYWNED